jgi:hypothetical protein
MSGRRPSRKSTDGSQASGDLQNREPSAVDLTASVGARSRHLSRSTRTQGGVGCRRPRKIPACACRVVAHAAARMRVPSPLQAAPPISANCHRSSASRPCQRRGLNARGIGVGCNSRDDSHQLPGGLSWRTGRVLRWRKVSDQAYRSRDRLDEARLLDIVTEARRNSEMHRVSTSSPTNVSAERCASAVPLRRPDRRSRRARAPASPSVQASGACGSVTLLSDGSTWWDSPMRNRSATPCSVRNRTSRFYSTDWSRPSNDARDRRGRQTRPRRDCVHEGC